MEDEVRMKALLEQLGLAAALEELPAATIAHSKSQSEHIDEFRKLVGDLTAIDTVLSDEDKALLLLLTSLPLSYDNSVETLLYQAKGDGGEGLYVRGRSGQRDMEQGTDSVWSKSQGRSSRLRCYICQSEEHLKKWICPVYNTQENSQGGSYHITYRRDYFVDFEEYEGGKILLGDGRECVCFRIKTKIDIAGQFLNKEGFSGRCSQSIKVIKVSLVGRTLKGRKQLGEFMGGRSRTGTSSVQVLQGVEFEVELQEDHTFEVEPHGNVDHVAGSQEMCMLLSNVARSAVMTFSDVYYGVIHQVFTTGSGTDYVDGTLYTVVERVVLSKVVVMWKRMIVVIVGIIKQTYRFLWILTTPWEDRSLSWVDQSQGTGDDTRMCMKLRNYDAAYDRFVAN
ncbi:hypothetical protein Tco_0418650 [Tanacetum coccineum]